MREVRVEEWAHAHPEQRLCSSRAAALSEGNFPESYTKKADEGLWMTPLRLSADHLSFLCSCTLRLSLRGEKAIPGILLQPQSLSCESSDEFLMCSDIKRENTIGRHTINSAQNRSGAVCVAGICGFTLLFIGLWKRGRLKEPLTDGSSCLSLKLWHTGGWRLSDLMTWLLLIFTLLNTI